MNLDFRSVILASSLLISLVALILFSYVLIAKPRSRALVIWALAYASLVAGAILIIFRGILPDVFSIVLANLGLVCGFFMLKVGIDVFYGKRQRLAPMVIALAAWSLWNIYFTAVNPSLPPRYYAYNLLVLGLGVWNAFAVGHKPPPGLETVSKMPAALFLGIGLTCLLRVGLAAFEGLPDKLMSSASWDSVIQAIQGALISVLAFSLILLRAESLNGMLAKAARDRELLLREMAHRTKNDLALVESLISIEQHSIERDAASKLSEGGESTSERLAAVRERIHCVGEAHARLSMSDKPGKVRLDEYLDAVATGLPTPNGIRVERDFAEIVAPFSLAAPLGLVMNELATNSIKYAFPNGREGSIRLSLKPGENGEGLRLEVRDDGVGTSWPPPKMGLGLMIVESFSEKLGGKIEFKIDKGSVFTLGFELPRQTS